jgi:hypothetical protein
VDWWSVSVESRAYAPGKIAGNGEIADAAMSAFTDLTQPYDGSIIASAQPPLWTATVSIEATGVADAVAEAVRLVTTLGADAGLPGWPVVRAAAVRQDMADGGLADLGMSS